jgi:hypothetical protein
MPPSILSGSSVFCEGNRNVVPLGKGGFRGILRSINLLPAPLFQRGESVKKPEKL